LNDLSVNSDKRLFLCYFFDMDIIKNFAVFEGGDGSGTTTQLLMLEEYIKREYGGRIPFFSTFEPTEGQIGKLIRAALKKEMPLQSRTLAMLFAADRNEHLYGEEGIISHINSGWFIASDRYALSSLVYQGIECGEELPDFLNRRFPAPEVTIFLDIEPETAIARIKKRSSLEMYEYIEFQEKVRAQYKAVITKYRAAGARVEIIDASKTANEVADQVWSILCQLPIFNV